jgi:shikimate kinase
LNNNNNNNNIFLIGFMGSGKSHWGRIWAKETGFTFYDLDAEIERSLQMSVEKIFEKHGEKKFREMEVNHLHNFNNAGKNLVACGGGTPCFFDNMEWMKEHGKVIYLQATPKKILDRVIDEKNKRPLLKEISSSELLYFIEKKLAEREPFYLKADHILNVEELNDESLNFLQKIWLQKE